MLLHFLILLFDNILSMRRISIQKLIRVLALRNDQIFKVKIALFPWEFENILRTHLINVMYKFVQANNLWYSWDQQLASLDLVILCDQRRSRTEVGSAYASCSVWNAKKTFFGWPVCGISMAEESFRFKLYEQTERLK